jgi:hypothetical protein
MLKTARYAATPHAVARNHKIPIGVIESLTGSREQDALDGKRCLFEVMVISHDPVPVVLPPVVLEPRSGGEVRFGKKVSPDYPEEFAPGEFIMVQITGIER